MAHEDSDLVRADKIKESSDFEDTAESMRYEALSPKTASGARNVVAPSNLVEDKSAEQRKAEEASEFNSRFQKQNIKLDPLQPGWGPYQLLDKMVKEHKINLSDDQVVQESRRISQRDFKDLGRNYYDLNDQILFWSDREISEKVAEISRKVKGIDVSEYQDDVDWKKVKAAGIDFAFLRASKGNDYVDPKFAANREGAREAGLKIGYYHYFRPDASVDQQVKTFVDTVGKAEPDSLRLVIDTENQKLWAPYTLPQRIKMIDDWCAGVKKALGSSAQVIIYGSPSFFDDSLKNDPSLAKKELWIANYKVAEPRVPKPWDTWKFWQYSETGKVPGINTNVDLDMYNGTDINSAFKSNRKPK